MNERPLRLSPLWELTYARILDFVRQPAAMFWTFGFPVLLVVALGIAFRTRPPTPTHVAVPQAARNTWIVEALAQDAGFAVHAVDAAAATALLRDGKADILLDTSDASPVVTYQFDAMRPESRTARLVVDAALQRARGRIDPVQVRDAEPPARGARYVDALVPGLIGWNLMGSSMWGIGYVVVTTRSQKLLKRFAATPMRRAHYLLSFVLSRLLFLGVEVAALVGFGVLAFDTVLLGSVGGFALVATLGALSFAGMALLVAARTSNVEVAQGLMNFVMLPMWILSGTFFSYDRFPAVLQPLIRILPLTALNDALRAIANHGAPLSSLGFEIAVLMAWGVGSFFVALRLFRWQ